MEKEIKIIPPEGYEVDKEKSTFEKIVFKEVNRKIDYQYISEKLFLGNPTFWIDYDGDIIDGEGGLGKDSIKELNNAPTREQLESILALNKLCNVAKYLNGDYLFTYEYKNIPKYYLALNINNDLFIAESYGALMTCVYFKTKELAKQAIEILGEEEIRKALTLNH